jgi:SPP1 gp7 family putative phage head morphogenesis protein
MALNIGVSGTASASDISKTIADVLPKQLAAPHSHKADFTDAEIKAVKAIDDEREKIVKRFKPKVKQYITQELDKAATNIRNGNDPTGGMDDGTHLAAIMKPVYHASIDAAYGKTNEQLASLDVSVAFDQTNPNVAKTVNGLLKKLKKDVPDTTKEAIRARVAAGLDAGESIDKIADGIVADAPEISDSRAEVIARTETASAYTEGAIISYKESGVVKAVKWLSTLDNRTSDICEGLNGQTVDLGEQFDGGYDGPPAHPNCRSAILPVVE